MKVKVSDIIVNERVRKNSGDLTGLKESIQKVGLLNPILIDMDNNLIAGFRRLESVKLLGWDYIDVKILDIKTKKQRLIIEREENLHRLEFTEEDTRQFLKLEKRYNRNTLTNWLNEWADRILKEFRRKKS
ncbi:MAG: ParB N-terminal domain-containing protein [Leptospiraceae bacterium]|nr:ParB N-terminal domain-containing protein [Leptospiraceae bacterium]MCP5511649.1 ParB N-terminal domain-containing protein [Leptospiraceae bacterium]